MVSVSGIVGGILLPYLSHDWEAGSRPAVAAKLNLAIKLLGVAMFAGSALVLLASPLLFGVAFHGKYDGGLAILPWTLTYCIWMALVPLAQMYLWCAERARLPTFALVAGLITNVVLCRLLLPGFGLHGVVWGNLRGEFGHARDHVPVQSRVRHADRRRHVAGRFAAAAVGLRPMGDGLRHGRAGT